MAIDKEEGNTGRLEIRKEERKANPIANRTS